jgi:hypothetical protein
VSPTIIIVFGFIASMTIGLLVPMLYTYTAEHFSTNARATGVALTDGLGHIGGRWRRRSCSAPTPLGGSRARSW